MLDEKRALFVDVSDAAGAVRRRVGSDGKAAGRRRHGGAEEESSALENGGGESGKFAGARHFASVPRGAASAGAGDKQGSASCDQRLVSRRVRNDLGNWCSADEMRVAKRVVNLFLDRGADRLLMCRWITDRRNCSYLDMSRMIKPKSSHTLR